MTHKSIPAEKRRNAGVADSLVRLSVGLEDAADLIGDLATALDKVVTQSKRTAAAAGETAA